MSCTSAGTRSGSALKDPSTPALNLNAGTTPIVPNRGRKEQAVSPAYAVRDQNQPPKAENEAQLTPPPLAKGAKQKGCDVHAVRAEAALCSLHRTCLFCEWHNLSLSFLKDKASYRWFFRLTLLHVHVHTATSMYMVSMTGSAGRLGVATDQ